MADRLTLVIGVDASLDLAVPSAVHAESDVAALAHAQERLGFALDNQIVLRGGRRDLQALPLLGG